MLCAVYFRLLCIQLQKQQKHISTKKKHKLSSNNIICASVGKKNLFINDSAHHRQHHRIINVPFKNIFVSVQVCECKSVSFIAQVDQKNKSRNHQFRGPLVDPRRLVLILAALLCNLKTSNLPLSLSLSLWLIFSMKYYLSASWHA